MPGPAEIAGKLLESRKGLGEYGTDGKFADGLHEVNLRGVGCPIRNA